ncbi:MAG: hypothetical protein PHT48_10355 [Dechloromonas sp.]|nr:hypothetical protein [Dechloromonas sp.]
MPETVIHLHRAAPAKPPEGAPCNGCGVCCALETCPVARLRFRQIAGPCPALHWSVHETRYFCGLLERPAAYLPSLPRWAEPALRRLLRRWISAGSGCDCHADVTS